MRAAGYWNPLACRLRVEVHEGFCGAGGAGGAPRRRATCRPPATLASECQPAWHALGWVEGGTAGLLGAITQRKHWRPALVTVPPRRWPGSAASRPAASRPSVLDRAPWAAIAIQKKCWSHGGASLLRSAPVLSFSRPSRAGAALQAAGAGWRGPQGSCPRLSIQVSGVPDARAVHRRQGARRRSVCVITAGGPARVHGAPAPVAAHAGRRSRPSRS